MSAGSQARNSGSLKPSATLDSKILKAKSKPVASHLQSTAVSNKKLRKAPTLSSPYSSQVNLSQLKKQVNKYNSSSPEQELKTTESFKLLNKTFAIKGDVTDSSDNTSSKVSLAMPGRSFAGEAKRKPTTNERTLQTRLDSIKTIEFNIYREVFNDTLGQMTTYRQVLEEVKSGYDARISSLEELTLGQSTQIEALQSQLEEERRDKGVFQRRLKKLAQENYQLSVNCEELSEALHNSLNLSAKEADPTLDSAHKEVESLNQAIQQMEESLQQAKEREKRLMKLLYVIKKRGIPIEEIYEQEVNSQSSSGDRPNSYASTKPSVPKLELDSVDKDDSEEYESDSDLFETTDKYGKTYSG